MQYVASGSDDFRVYIWKIPEGIYTFLSSEVYIASVHVRTPSTPAMCRECGTQFIHHSNVLGKVGPSSMHPSNVNSFTIAIIILGKVGPSSFE